MLLHLLRLAMAMHEEGLPSSAWQPPPDPRASLGGRDRRSTAGGAAGGAARGAGTSGGAASDGASPAAAPRSTQHSGGGGGAANGASSSSGGGFVVPDVDAIGGIRSFYFERPDDFQEVGHSCPHLGS